MKKILTLALLIGFAFPAWAESLHPSNWSSGNNMTSVEDHNNAAGNHVMTPAEHAENMQAQKTSTNSFFSSDTTVKKNPDGTINLKKVLHNSHHDNINRAWADLNQ